MAERRMFAKTIIDSDAFLDMPLSTQALYFHLNMRADDEGFINNPKKIARMIGCADDDLKLLLAKSFIIAFEDGVIVIKHWKLNNYIQSDRFKPTVYTEDKALLSLKDNKAYTLNNECIRDVYSLDTQVRLGKNSIDKNKDIASNLEPSFELVLKDNTLYPIYPTDVNKYKELYPKIDVEQQLRSMVGWCDSNPQKRKTRSGVKRFINSWLSRENDRKATAPVTASKPKFNDFENKQNYDDFLSQLNANL